MAYGLGIDIGTTFTAAAVCRNSRVETVELGDRAAAVPSVLYLGADGSVQVGEAANRRALQEPGRVAREFKRRVGDPAPVIVGGSPYSADGLVAKLLAWVVNAVSAREGGRPSSIMLTCPANWGPYKRDLMQQAADRAGLGKVSLMTEPEAAAAAYAASERLAVGTTVAVYDLGGGTFDSAVLRKTQGGFEILGSPQGIERLGGVDFDEAVFAHVQEAMKDNLDKLDPADPAQMAAVARLRAECVAAKETLSADTEVSIAVMLPGVHTTVRLVRSEFEEMIRPAITETVAALRRAVSSAGLKPADIDTVLLVGGSSRIPLVSQLVSAELGRPIATDVHPTNAVAIGAAHATDVARAVAPAARGAAPVPAAARAGIGRPSAAAGAAKPLVARTPPAVRPKPPTPAAAPTPRKTPPPVQRPGPARSLANSGPTPRPSSPPAPEPKPASKPAGHRPPRTLYLPDEPAMPTVNPRRPGPAAGTVKARRVLRVVLIVAVVAAVLLVAWLALSYVNKLNVADPGPETPSPSAAAATTNTAATDPTKDAVANLAAQPCKALTNQQATQLGLQSPGQDGVPGLCSWSGKGIPGVTVSAVTGADAYEQAINNQAGYAHFEFIEVSNRKAVQYGGGGDCGVTVRISASESITAGSSGPANDAQNPSGCGEAKATAAAVLANF